MTPSDTAAESTVVELVPADDDSTEMDADKDIEESVEPDAEASDVSPTDDDLRLVEALLFASASAVTERTISERLGDDADVPALLQRLKQYYKGRGIELTRAGNRWYFRTAPDLGDRMKLEKIVPRKLSRAGIETLAIISYHQPVTRAEIEEIRGVVISRGTLDILLEEGWIKPKGKRQTPGRPTTWGTTDAFLDHFGLESLNDLPGIEELKAAGLLDPRKGVASYTARAEDGDTLLFDTDEADDVLEPLGEDDEPAIESDASGQTVEETEQSDDVADVPNEVPDVENAGPELAESVENSEEASLEPDADDTEELSGKPDTVADSGPTEGADSSEDDNGIR